MIDYNKFIYLEIKELNKLLTFYADSNFKTTDRKYLRGIMFDSIRNKFSKDFKVNNCKIDYSGFTIYHEKIGYSIKCSIGLKVTKNTKQITNLRKKNICKAGEVKISLISKSFNMISFCNYNKKTHELNIDENRFLGGPSCLVDINLNSTFSEMMQKDFIYDLAEKAFEKQGGVYNSVLIQACQPLFWELMYANRFKKNYILGRCIFKKTSNDELTEIVKNKIKRVNEDILLEAKKRILEGNVKNNKN